MHPTVLNWALFEAGNDYTATKNQSNASCLIVLVIGFVAGAAVTDYLQDRYNKASALAAGFMAMDSLKQRDTDRALAFVHQSITLNPGSYSGYYFLGNIYANEGKSDLALEMYEKALTKTYKIRMPVFLISGGSSNPLSTTGSSSREKLIG